MALLLLLLLCDLLKGLDLSRVVLDGLVRTNMVLYGYIWSCLFLFGLLRSSMNWFVLHSYALFLLVDKQFFRTKNICWTQIRSWLKILLDKTFLEPKKIFLAFKIFWTKISRTQNFWHPKFLFLLSKSTLNFKTSPEVWQKKQSTIVFPVDSVSGVRLQRRRLCQYIRTCGILSPPYSTTTQLSQSLVWHKYDFAHHHHHPLGTQCWQYLSCYWPDFDQTLKVGCWDQHQQ